MKKIVTLIAVMLFNLFLFCHAAAAGELLVDGADLFTPEEESRILAGLEALKSEHSMDFVVVTTNDTGGKSNTAFADDYYDYNGYSSDGVLLLINMDSAQREYRLSTTGAGITAFTDYGIEYVLDEMYPDMASGDYAGAVDEFIEAADWLVDQYEAGTPYDVPPEPERPAGLKGFDWIKGVLIALAVGAGAGIAVTQGLKAQHKTVRKQVAAASYMVPGSLNLTNSSDTFLYRNVTHVPIPKKDPPSGGGGGSSIHIGSSGVSHGGGGRRF
ncbi:MAG: TPM domain-containing protein [Lachnospiraceae bacterium]|jgi:uncharacterized protein